MEGLERKPIILYVIGFTAHDDQITIAIYPLQYLNKLLAC
jgi:hypothetical protein